MKVTKKINLPPKQGGWMIHDWAAKDRAIFYMLVDKLGKGPLSNKSGDFILYLEGIPPHSQSLCIEYDDGVLD